MCTLSWNGSGERFSVGFNRDESKARGPEVPVDELLIDGVRVLAPRDSDFGGTWIAANEYGLVVCVLNAYADSVGAPRETYESRGRLVLATATAESIEALRARVTTPAVEVYRPFVLVAFDALESGPTAFRFDGAAVRVDREPSNPLASSGADRERAQRARSQAFLGLARDGGLSDEALVALHASHESGPSSDSVCMHREDAETKSFVRVRVGRERVELEHHLGAPCRDPEVVTRSFARKDVVPAG